MGCSKCGRPELIFQEYSGLHLCRQHFREDLLHKAKKTVRKNQWLVPGKRYAVALSGGPVSCALLDFMHSLVGDRKDISLVAITIKNDDTDGMATAREITEESGIPWYVIPEDATIISTQLQRAGTTNRFPFLAHALTEERLAPVAVQLKIDSLSIGYTLEDHAGWALWKAISGDITQKSGLPENCRNHVRIIRPFMHIPWQELELYSRLFLNDYYKKAQAESDNCMDDPVNCILAQFYRRHPGVPYALVNIGEQVKKFRDQVS
jgi:tRNA(Ile)-lysidine synthase TilS/MesJ